MAVVFNGTTRQIEVTDPAIFELDAGKELYSAWKRWQQLDPANAGYAPAFHTFGGDGTATGQFAPKYYFLQNYWRVLINNGNVVAVAINLYSDDYTSPYVVVAGSGVSDRNSDAVSINNEDIEYGSFQNGVWIDTSSGYSGTSFPVGTPRQPVNNLTDAQLIADSRGFRTLYIANNMTFLGTDNIDNYEIVGEDVNKTIIAVLPGCSTTRTEFVNCELSGDVSGSISVRNCHLDPIVGIGSTIYDTVFSDCYLEAGTYGVTATSTKPVVFINCHSGVAGALTPTINSNGSTSDIMFRNYNGGIELTNYTGGQNSSFDINSGQLKVDSTCTAGNITVRGVGMLTDNSGAGCIVSSPGLVNTAVVADAVWDETLADHTSVGSTGEALDNVSAGASPTAIADAVWDKDISAYVTDGKAGYELKIARLQAALAAALSA